MKGLAWTSAIISLGLACSGCSLISGAVDKSRDDGNDSSGGGAPATASYAGKWTRQDNKAQFEVTDDGTKVEGKLVKGTYLYEKQELFASFTFSLKRQGGKLKGQAKFAFVDAPKDTFTTDWECKLDGSTIKATVEALEFDDAGNVAKRTKEKKEFALAAAAPAAAPAAGAYKMDVTKMIKAPARIPLKDVKQGWLGRQEMTSAGRTMTTQYAIVGEEGGSWRVEFVSPALAGYVAMDPDVKDMVMGLVVDKQSGKVTKAVLGKRGEKGKPIGIGPDVTGSAKAPEGEDVEVEVKAGTFPAKLYTSTVANYGTTKTWVGTDGAVKGVMLKIETPKGKGNKELKSEPSETDLDLGGTSIAVKKAVYDNGDETWTSENEVVKAMFAGQVLMKTASVNMKLTKIATDAKPELKW